MPARRTYGTAPLKDIMENDIETCVKKAKARYSDEKFIYITKVYDFYFADRSMIMLKPEEIIRTYQNLNYNGIKKQRAKWVLVEN